MRKIQHLILSSASFFVNASQGILSILYKQDKKEYWLSYKPQICLLNLHTSIKLPIGTPSKQAVQGILGGYGLIKNAIDRVTNGKLHAILLLKTDERVCGIVALGQRVKLLTLDKGLTKLTVVAEF